MKLKKRIREEGRAEVYEKHYSSSIPLFLRISTVIYFSWVSVEVILMMLRIFSTPRILAPNATGLDLRITHFLSAGLFLELLHKYITWKILRYGFRIVLSMHQASFAAISLWLYTTGERGDAALTGLQVILSCVCAIGEMCTFVGVIVEYP